MENYLSSKMKLFKACGNAVLNLDDEYYEEIRNNIECPVVTYSASSTAADYRACEIRGRTDGVDFELVGFDNLIGRVRFGTPGKFSVYNALSASVTAISAGLPFAGVVDWISDSAGVKGRMEHIETGKGFSVIIDYAHTPDGLKNVLSALRESAPERLIAVFGCGGDRDRSKRPQMGEIAGKLADYVILTSDNPRSEEPLSIIKEIEEGLIPCGTEYEVEVDRREAIRKAITMAKTGDVIVLAGKGHEAYQILKNGTVHLDEREVIQQALESL